MADRACGHIKDAKRKARPGKHIHIIILIMTVQWHALLID